VRLKSKFPPNTAIRRKLCVKKMTTNESSASEGVEAMAEIAGDDAMSKNPGDDLSNEEKNQY